MAPIDPASAKEFLESLIAAFAVLGGVMAYFSGFAAYWSLKANEPPSVVAHKINEGIADGFERGAPTAILALMIMGWT